MVFVIFIIFTALCNYVITVDFAEHLSLEVYLLCWLTEQVTLVKTKQPTARPIACAASPLPDASPTYLHT